MNNGVRDDGNIGNILNIQSTTIECLRNENEKLKFVLSKFEDWYCEYGCPYSEHRFCPQYDELKKEHEAEMAKSDEEDRYEFDPSENCGMDCQEGWCFARYFEKLWNDQKALKESEGR